MFSKRRLAAFFSLFSLLSASAPAASRVGTASIHAFRQVSREGIHEKVVRTQLIEDGTHFRPQNVALGKGESVLARGEKFPLELMFQRGFISKEQYEFFQSVGSKLDPDQIQFYEFNRWYTAIEAARKFESIPTHWVSEAELGQEGMLLNIRRGFLWSVSGQVLDPEFRPGNPQRWVRRRLAIEYAPEFHTLPEWPFPTDAFVFEWGRAGTLEAESLPRLAQLAIIHNVNEVISLGGDLSKAWVVAGASDEAHLRLYRDTYKFEVFGQVPGNTYLRRRLTDLVADPRVAPRKTSKKIARLVELAREAGVLRQSLSDSDAIRFLSELKTQMKAPLDIEPLGGRSAKRSPPIWLQDRSHAFLTIALKHLTDIGLAPVKEKVSEFLQQQASSAIPVPELDDRVADPSLWDRRNSVYLSGLERWVAANPAENPLYPVIAAFRHYLKRLSVVAPAHVPYWMIEPNLIHALEESQVMVTVFLKDQRLAERMRELGARVEPTEIVWGFKGNFEERDWRKLEMVRTPGWRLVLRPTELISLESRFFLGKKGNIQDAAQLGYWRALLGLHEDLLL